MALLILSILGFSSPVFAKIPPEEFAQRRLLKTRIPSSVFLEISVFEKTINRYSGRVELYAGDFHLSTLHVSISSSSFALRLIAVALGSQSVFQTFDKIWSAREKTTKVSVLNDALVHCYGTRRQMCMDRQSGELASLTVLEKKTRWELIQTRMNDVLKGVVYENGVVILRYTATFKVVEKH